MSVPFPAKYFRECLEETRSIHSRLSKEFELECKKHNMTWISGITESLFKIFTTKETIKLKVNSMYAIMFFLQLAEYPLITLFEVYLLPTIMKVSLFRNYERSLENTSQFFESEGYSATTPNIKELSHNYMMLADEVIFFGANIKPFRAFQSNEMSEDSLWAKAAKQLIKSKIKPKDNKTEEELYRERQARMIYKQNLERFDNDSQAYIAHFVQKIQNFIVKGTKFTEVLDFRKIMKFGDVLLTSEAIGRCCDALQNDNLFFKRNALTQIHDFILWGDIEAIMMINYGDCVDKIMKKIEAVRGDISLSAGQQIYPEIIGQNDLKYQFYTEFLKCLHTWAICFPQNSFDWSKEPKEREEFSPIFHHYSRLKEERRFKFPENPYLVKHKKELQENMQNNTERNRLIVMQLEQNLTLSQSVSQGSQQSLQVAANKFEKYQPKGSTIKEMKESSIVTESEIRQIIETQEGALQKLLKKTEANDMEQVSRILKKGKGFVGKFDEKLDAIEEGIEERQLEDIVTRGLICAEKIEAITDCFQKYKREEINLMKFEEETKYHMENTGKQNRSSYFESYKSSKRDKSNTNGSALRSNLMSSKSNNFMETLKSQSRHSKPQVSGSAANVQQSHGFQSDSVNKGSPNGQLEGLSHLKRTAEQGLSDGRQGQGHVENQKLKSSGEQDEDEGSYDFEVQNYDFREVKSHEKAAKSSGEDNVSFSRQSEKNSAIKTDSHRSSGSRLSSKHYQNSDIKVQFSKVSSKKSHSHLSSSIPQKIDQSYQSSRKNQKRGSSKSSQKASSIRSSKNLSNPNQNPAIYYTIPNDTKKVDGNFQERNSSFRQTANESQVSFKKSPIMIRRTSPKKEYAPATDNKNNNSESFSISLGEKSGRIDTKKGSNPHKIQDIDSKELTSVNTNLADLNAAFSKQHPSSGDRISSIEQKKFKIEMFNENSVGREVFEDSIVSSKSKNQSLEKIKEEVEKEQNPTYGAVFKNKSGLQGLQSKNSGLVGAGPQSSNYASRDLVRINQMSAFRDLSPVSSRMKIGPNVSNNASDVPKAAQTNKNKMDSQSLSQVSDSKKNQKPVQSSRGSIKSQKKRTDAFLRNPTSEFEKQPLQEYSSGYPATTSKMETVKRDSSLSGRYSPSSLQEEQEGKIAKDEPSPKLVSRKFKQSFNVTSFATSETPKINERSSIYFQNKLQRPLDDLENPQLVNVLRDSQQRSSQQSRSSLRQHIKRQDVYRGGGSKENYNRTSLMKRSSHSGRSRRYEQSSGRSHSRASFVSQNSNSSSSSIDSRYSSSSYHRFQERRKSQIQTHKSSKSIYSESNITKKSRVSGLKQKVIDYTPEIKSKIQVSPSKIQYLANKELQEIKRLRQKLEQMEKAQQQNSAFRNTSLMQRFNEQTPEKPRHFLSPRSPRFRSQNYSFENSLFGGGNQRKALLQSFQNQSHSRSSPYTQRVFDLDSSFSQQYLVTPQGKIFKKTPYEKYLTQTKKQKKRLLRNKDLVWKDRNIEIGITILRERSRLKLIYFVEAVKIIDKFWFSVDCQTGSQDNPKKLELKINPQSQFTNLAPLKQYKIYILCQIRSFPFYLPKISFNYEIEVVLPVGPTTTNYTEKKSYTCLLPVYFPKFMDIEQISHPQLELALESKQQFRTEEFPLNSKLIKKPHQIHNYIPNLILLSESQAVTIFCAKAVFFKHEFIFKVNVKTNHFMFIQCLSLQNGKKGEYCQKIMEWFMLCLQNLFMKQIKIEDQNKAIDS